MRSDRCDVASTHPADGNDLVTCSVHGSRRLARFCVRIPVYNADRVMVGYTYNCKEEMQCAASASRNSFAKQHDIRGVAEGRDDASPELLTRSVATTPTTAAGVVAATEKDAAPQQQRTGAARGPNRYYDLTKQRDSDAAGKKKVCWNCGMEGHEKPECCNTLCRTCHTTRGHHHLCQEPRPSPFLNLSPTTLLSEDMSFVQCVSCSSFGHFDCSTSRETRIPSCCFCGERGHNAYDCSWRKRRVPDRWVTRVKEAENGMAYRENSGASAALPSVFNSLSTVYASPGYNQASAWRERGAPSYVANWNAGRRENGSYGGGASSGGHYATNSRPYNDRSPYSGYNGDRHNVSHTREMDQYANYGLKRSRWGDDEDLSRNKHHQQSRTHDHYRDLDSNQQGNQRVGRNHAGSRGEGEKPHVRQSYQNNGRYQRKQRRRNRGGSDSDDDYENLF
ncbi:hypothetical protein TcBrA4_0089930 [Trypanosoma cruzi]|nr:hypothetical protein TcBrA4_0089930 [Trypanosoma cruzi]